MKKIVTIVGARPQFVKAAAVSRILSEQKTMKELILHTGQHYDKNMSEDFFSELAIPKPAINLEIGSSSHGEQTGRMLTGIEKYLMSEKPDVVMVYGDTNSTLAGALAAAKLNIPVVHVEAGMRSFNRRMPEEVNRIVADCVSTLLFAPTVVACENLRHEGVDEKKIVLTGDVMYDAALYFEKMADEKSSILSELKLYSKSFILATIHRAENTDDKKRLSAVIDGFNHLAQDYTIVLPLHPRTRKILGKISDGRKLHKNIIVINPVGYLDMIILEKNAFAIVTDSGGIQKEAYFYKVPCVTVRDETEWPDLLNSGWNMLAPPESPEVIINAVKKQIAFKPSVYEDYFGKGDASVRICEAIKSL